MKCVDWDLQGFYTRRGWLRHPHAMLPFRRRKQFWTDANCETDGCGFQPPNPCPTSRCKDALPLRAIPPSVTVTSYPVQCIREPSVSTLFIAQRNQNPSQPCTADLRVRPFSRNRLACGH